jgi:hypothetical protein
VLSLNTNSASPAIQAADGSSSQDDKVALQTAFAEMYRHAWQMRDVSNAGAQTPMIERQSVLASQEFELRDGL